MEQVLYVRPYVDDFSFNFLVSSTLTLTAGAMILMYIGEVIPLTLHLHASLRGGRAPSYEGLWGWRRTALHRRCWQPKPKP